MAALRFTFLPFNVSTPVGSRPHAELAYKVAVFLKHFTEPWPSRCPAVFDRKTYLLCTEKFWAVILWGEWRHFLCACSSVGAWSDCGSNVPWYSTRGRPTRGRSHAGWWTAEGVRHTVDWRWFLPLLNCQCMICKDKQILPYSTSKTVTGCYYHRRHHYHHHRVNIFFWMKN